MRAYYLRLNKSDFQSANNNSWISHPIDAYVNDSFVNYSTVKSSYGLNLADGSTVNRKFVWVGMKKLASPHQWQDFQYFTWEDLVDQTWIEEGSLYTDTGEIFHGRYVDKSGRIDVIDYVLNLDPTSAVNGYSIDVYQSTSPYSAFPDEWIKITADGQEIDITDSDRYLKFVVNFDPYGPDFDGTLFVRIEIDRPVMTPLYSETRNILDKFPKWMAVREFDTQAPATPSLAQPTSLGGNVINTISGEWLDDVNENIQYLHDQLFIDTVDLTQKAWVYRTDGIPAELWEVDGDNGPTSASPSWEEEVGYIHVGRAVDTRELLEATPEEHVVLWDEAHGAIFSNQKYELGIVVNGVHYDQDPFHVWNWIDEIGLSLDLPRLLLEDNDSYRLRILDIYLNRAGVGLDEFKLALRRELNMWKYYATPATPDSFFLGATPEVLEMSDIEEDPLYTAPDGMPTQKFVDLVQKLSKLYPTTWGRFHWDEALWDVSGEKFEGFSVLPYRMDAEQLPLNQIQSGVGDGDDLFVFRPDTVTGAHQFNSRLRLRGRQRTQLPDEYPPVTLEFLFYGQADKTFYINPTVVVPLTVEITTTDSGSPVYFSNFTLESKSDVDATNPTTPTPSSWATQQLFDISDKTSMSLAFLKKTNGAAYPSSDGRIPHSVVSSIVLKNGWWSVVGQNYSYGVGSDMFSAWFSDNPTVKLIYNTSSISALSGSRGSIQLSSKRTSTVIDKWQSTPISYTITINNNAPFTSATPVTFVPPVVNWDAHLQPTPNKQYVFRITTTDNNGNFAAKTHAIEGNDFFIPSSYISMNGSSTWASGSTQTINASTTSVIFATTSGSLYPVGGSTWTLFERTQDGIFSGVVDENGPWREGNPPTDNNTDFGFVTASVNRTDFGVPNTDDYIVTWMGVDLVTDSDPDVIVWLDNNIVASAVTEPYNSVTPSGGVIQERFDNGEYFYDPFTIRCRLNLTPSVEWKPQIHSGWFYERDQDYYFYAEPITETTVSTESRHVLSGVARQGAPIIVTTNNATPTHLRQVSFYDETATPTTLRINNTQNLIGTGTNNLYLAYEDIYDVTVTDLTTNQSIALVSTASSTNVISTLSQVTNPTHTYQVDYTLAYSFYVDNNYLGTDDNFHTEVVFDKPASTYGTTYNITYENSIFNPAAVVDLPLSPLFTTLAEGFIFISHDEYTLDRVLVYVTPSQIVADGQDYLVLNIYSQDTYGNPKPNQVFNLNTTFGTFDNTTITTDRDGYATATLTADNTTASLSGTITITGIVSTTAQFLIQPATVRGHRLFAVVRPQEIPADGRSKVIIYGKVEDQNYRGVPGAFVRWKRARSIYDLYGGSPGVTTVTADSAGHFTIGPITAANQNTPGFWFLSMESDNNGDLSWSVVGDVVFWNEYPDTQYGAENMTGLPIPMIQMATPISSIPEYATPNHLPVYYDDADPFAPATPVTHNWQPPVWYIIKNNKLYQINNSLASRLGYKVIFDLVTLRQFRPMQWRLYG